VTKFNLRKGSGGRYEFHINKIINKIRDLKGVMVETRGIEPFLVRIRLLLLQINQILGEVSIALEPNNKT
jgi:hypothetical protein